jgi:hypothetical protein
MKRPPKFEYVPYARFERDPIGCFMAEMTASGWAKTKFDHKLQEHLLSNEVSEFLELVQSFFKEADNWLTLNKFKQKYGTRIAGDLQRYAMNVIGEVLDYTIMVTESSLEIFPYRKFRRDK